LQLINVCGIGPDVNGVDGRFMKNVGYHEIVVHVDVFAVGAEDGGGIIEGREHVGFGDKAVSQILNLFLSWSSFTDDVEEM
jgi:hypothetical protein